MFGLDYYSKYIQIGLYKLSSCLHRFIQAKLMSTSVYTRLKLMSTSGYTRSKLMSTLVHTRSKLMSTSVYTRLKLMSTSVYARPKLMSTFQIKAAISSARNFMWNKM